MAKNGIQTARRFSGYVVQRRLGSGANSNIFEVLEPASGNSFALKRVVKKTLSDERFFRQTENEYEIGRQLHHPNIRGIHELFRIRNFFRVREMHLLMEVVYGKSLEAERPTSVSAAVRIFRLVCEGLAAMHAAGFAHADMKPNNVIVTPRGEVKIIDLGQSCPLGTIKQRIQGTPDYIAPEQVHRRPIDRRTDIFNIGATMYWVLTKTYVPTVLPKTQPGREIALVTTTPTPTPAELNPQVPQALSRLVMDCVQVRPADRPETMKEVIGRLETIELIMARGLGKAGLPQGEPNRMEDQDSGFEASNDSEQDTVDLPGMEAV